MGSSRENYEENNTFKIGDKVVCRSDGKVYTVAHSLGKSIAFEGLKGLYHAAAFDLYTETKSTIETYTPSELSEIDELRDRVDYLQDLCSDLNKIIAEKDDKIESMQEVIDELSSLGCTNGW